MMEYTQARALFFRLVAGADEKGRQEAFEALANSGLPDFDKIARLGLVVSKAVIGDDGPSALAEAFRIGDVLPHTDINNAFFEISAQALLSKGSGMEDGGERRSMMEWGLALMRRAMFGGLPVSEESVMMMREAKRNAPSVSEAADLLIIRNESLLPAWSRLREERAHSADARKKEKLKGG